MILNFLLLNKSKKNLFPKTLSKLILFLHLALTFQFSITNSQQPTQEWVARYERPSGSSAIPNQMALDKLGNCYVFGNIPITSGVGGFLVIKYNSIGDTIWTRTYNIGTGNATINEAIVADSIGNVYVVGAIGPSFGPYDIITIKYAPTGIQEWLKIYSGAGNVSDSPGGITLDKFGRPYVAGTSGNDAVIIKYNTNGDSLWIRKFNILGNRCGVGPIEVNLQGYIYSSGNSTVISNNQRYYLITKYDSNGVLQWSDTYTSSGSEIAHQMKLDNLDNCFITGEGSDGVTYGALTMKYNSLGVRLWLRVLRYGVGTNANDLVTDQNGNAYVTGSYSVGGSNFNYVTIKYSSIGDSVWVMTYNGPANANDESYSIARDDSNNLYITGRSNGTGTSRDYATIKYNENGTQQWLMRYNGPLGNGEDIANQVKIDKNKNVYVTGISDRGGVIFDYATIKYSQPVGITNISTQIPNQSYLSQNYPNPFNPKTNIVYQIPKSESVQLIVYDALGKEIVTLVNKRQLAGSYKVDFEASSYPSGIYFYRLITENYVETKKMILIK